MLNKMIILNDFSLWSKHSLTLTQILPLPVMDSVQNIFYFFAGTFEIIRKRKFSPPSLFLQKFHNQIRNSNELLNDFLQIFRHPPNKKSFNFPRKRKVKEA